VEFKIEEGFFRSGTAETLSRSGGMTSLFGLQMYSWLSVAKAPHAASEHLKKSSDGR